MAIGAAAEESSASWVGRGLPPITTSVAAARSSIPGLRARAGFASLVRILRPLAHLSESDPPNAALYRIG